jgi:hypothetical protein
MSVAEVVLRTGERPMGLHPTLRRRVVLLGTPRRLIIWMLFHPYDDYLDELGPIADWCITLHTLQFVPFALMGAAVWMLAAGLRGIAATLSRVAAMVFAIFYDAFYGHRRPMRIRGQTGRGVG